MAKALSPLTAAVNSYNTMKDWQGAVALAEFCTFRSAYHRLGTKFNLASLIRKTIHPITEPLLYLE